MDEAATTPPPAKASPWDRYRPWRRTFEVGFWVALYAVNAIAGSITSLMDGRDRAPASWYPRWATQLESRAAVAARAGVSFVQTRKNLTVRREVA